MNGQNPFTNTFGSKPVKYVENPQITPILENFSYPDPTNPAYMITGVRGSGKTVMLSSIAEKIAEDDSWIVIDILPGGDMISSLASKLYSHPVLKIQFAKLRLDLSFLGIGISIEGDSDRFFNMETAIEKMFSIIKEMNKKVFITIDEAGPGKEMERFCLLFQSLIRNGFPAYLIMTGLHNKINDIQKMEKCTFLLRTSKVVIEPLDIGDIMVSYKKTFGIEKEKALVLAGLTKGYAYAYQVLGRIYFDNAESLCLGDMIEIYEGELNKYAYKIIWDGLSENDCKAVKGIVALGNGKPVKREDLMEHTGFSSSMMNEYKDRLREAGVISPAKRGSRGWYQLALPRFENFVKDYHL